MFFIYTWAINNEKTIEIVFPIFPTLSTSVAHNGLNWNILPVTMDAIYVFHQECFGMQNQHVALRVQKTH